MRTLALAAGALALVLHGAAVADARHSREGVANPSAIIAAEIAFARLAREKGQWTAFRKTATKDAEMFVPRRVLAQEWLKKQADPPESLNWQPHEAWVACDGSYGVTRGAWQRGDAANGYFTTVWQRQDKKGGYLWVLDQGDALARPLSAPDMLAGNVASCTRISASVPAEAVPAGVDARDGASGDRSLQWRSWVWLGGARRFSVWLWNGSAFDEVIRSEVKAPGQG